VVCQHLVLNPHLAGAVALLDCRELVVRVQEVLRGRDPVAALGVDWLAVDSRLDQSSILLVPTQAGTTEVGVPPVGFAEVEFGTVGLAEHLQ